MNPYAFPPFATAIIISAIGIFVFARNKKSNIHRVFSTFSLVTIIWLFGYGMMYLTKDSNRALFWARTGFLGIIFIPILSYHFISTFLNLKNKKSLVIIYLLSIPSLLLSYTSYIYNGIGSYFWGYYPTAGKIYSLFLFMFVILFGKGLWLLFVHYRKETGVRKEQIKYLGLGFAVGTLGAIDYLAKYPLFYNIYPFGYICALAFYSIIAYAIIKYRLMDIKVALTRAGIFTVVYTLILGIPFWLGYVTKSWLPATSLAVLLASSGPFIYTYLRRHAEDIILKDQRRYQKALRELSKTMTRIRELDKLLKMIVLTVVDTVKVSYAGIYLKDEEYKSYGLKHCYPQKEKTHFQDFIPSNSPLIKMLYQQRRPLMQEEIASIPNLSLDSGLAIPCFMEDELLGFLIMGSKPNHQMYTADDVLVFETLSYSTSLAIENCRFWREIEDRQRKARLQEMDTYSYSLAHEIDNPVQIILGEAGFLKKFFLKDTSLPEEKQKDAETILDFILESASRISGMVRAIREFGSPTTGELKPLKIKDVAESYLRLYLPQFKAEGVVLEKIIPDTLGMVRGEKPELMQVLVILSNNSLHAMKYSEEKKITLKLEQINSDLVRISFTDSGCGIKKELLPIIFSPFTTTKASSEGIGMGFYNAKKMIDRHKGRI